MRRRWMATVAITVLLVLGGGGLAFAAAGPRLVAQGPVSLDGTTASARFEVGERTIRQFRYADRHELGYRFALHNQGPLPLTVLDAGVAGPQATLLRVDRLEQVQTSATQFAVPPGETARVRLVIDMTDCERVSSRAGSFLDRVRLRTRVGGVLDRSVVLSLPEELHTGSPREALCPRATSSSRSPG